MRHRIAGRQLGRTSAHRKALLRNQVTDLLRHERLVTTEAKAKEVRPLAEKLISLARQDSLHTRRRAAAVLTDRKLLRRLFTEIGPHFAARPGGYTRITKLGPRLGDGAEMAQIAFVDAVHRAPPTAGGPPSRDAGKEPEAEESS